MSAPPEFAHGDPQLVSYLLGLLTDEDTERLDEMSFVDDHVALDLRVVENDLVDAYVRGAMTGNTRQRFESAYVSSPHRLQKVRFAEAFLAVTERRERLWSLPPTEHANCLDARAMPRCRPDGCGPGFDFDFRRRDDAGGWSLDARSGGLDGRR